MRYSQPLLPTLRAMATTLPAIPAKRYFTIGEVGELCDVKPHVLRYWEQEFTQLRPMKRRGNRRYYQHHEVLMIRRIRDLLYEDGFTISGARNKLQDWVQTERGTARGGVPADGAPVSREASPLTRPADAAQAVFSGARQDGFEAMAFDAASAGHDAWGHVPVVLDGELPPVLSSLRRELFEIRALLEAAA